ncbi:winged helix-turn-helix domain-containing protein [Flavimaricola marinus]|uniref:Winged helix DNA-binding domain-containing protein n=1 Tax=Flavimaricola marinus TaxID=1819565 RepID=A0A238LHF5_9RHOB|nr:crosslink repair DNA glycosylase YcaQ family protein [Flavimaricola marinus]SMY08386.1 hypothetical protein LOM8899_02537 [Flavimaricola marinus]
MTLPQLGNDAARRLFLDRHGLLQTGGGPGKGADLAGVIGDLGFVQVDSVNTFARAHDLILWARRGQYRSPALDSLLAKDRAVFEHWTHDAAVIPMDQFPHWRHRFDRDAAWLHSRWSEWRREGFLQQIDEVRRHVQDHGHCTSRDVGKDEAKGSGGWWDWHPSKTALEYLWRTGECSVVRRDGFRKVYDLTERVIPPDVLKARTDEQETIDWACNSALDKLGFGTSGELAAFWALATPAEAKSWCAAALARGEIIEIEVLGHDGAPRRSFTRPGVLEQARALPDASSRVRILSPFDPALRDRKRAERLFGFHYRIEIFVPEAQRKYGYYVFPVMEGTQMIGRIDMKADRSTGALNVTGFWPEPGVKWGKGRQSRLEAELDRAKRLGGCDRVEMTDGWLRQ